MEFEGLARLEEIIGRLLTQYAELQEQNQLLVADVAVKQQMIDRLNDDVQAMQGNKEEVHHRLTTILTKLEEWEQSKEEPAAVVHDTATQEGKTPDQESPKHLFNLGG